MRREELKALVEDAEMSIEQKMDTIMKMNGEDITREKSVAEHFKAEAETLKANSEKYSNYDAIVAERDTLLAEKADRVLQDRFTTVLGEYKPKNDFTRQGLLNNFKASVADEANKDKADDEIWNAMISGHEEEYFEGKVQIETPRTNPNPQNPSDDEVYLNAKYANNPFYKKN